MFETLSERLSGILDKITGRGALSESDVDEALREVRRALLEADVALEVVRTFTDKVKAKAVGAEIVTPSPAAYLRASRAGRVIGHVDVVAADQVLGWAAQRPQTNRPKPLRVSLEVNGREVAQGLADHLRQDLVDNGAHPTGYAGFDFRLGREARLRPGDEVRVFAGEGQEELNRSPWRYAPPGIWQSALGWWNARRRRG